MKENKANNNPQEIDYNILAEKLNESNTETIKSMLEEHVKQAYARILNESDNDEEEDNDYEVEEVNDTENQPNEETEENGEEGTEPEATKEEITKTTEETPEGEKTTVADVELPAEGDETEDMDQDFDKFKVGDNEYDFRDAEDDDLVKVYKKLKDSDGIQVVKDGNKVQIKDNENDAEYLIDLGSDDTTSDVIEDDNNNTDDMTNESKIFEIALNEYDSHVGYTDNYQKKDPMTNPGTSEPSKHGRDIDDGAPKGATKPWSKEKKSVAPFNGGKGQTVECGDPAIVNNAPEVDEHAAGGRQGAMGRMTGIKSHRPNSGNIAQPEGQHNISVAGEYKGKPSTNESLEKKLNKIVKENQSLKAKLNDVTKMLQEAAVVNVNLGGIIKLITENSTTKDEKHEIVNRFTKEAHTVKESQTLYESIASELKKKPQTVVNINEEKQFTNTDSKTINESKFYQDESLMSSLGLMHKIC